MVNICKQSSLETYHQLFNKLMQNTLTLGRGLNFIPTPSRPKPQDLLLDTSKMSTSGLGKLLMSDTTKHGVKLSKRLAYALQFMTHNKMD